MKVWVVMREHPIHGDTIADVFSSYKAAMDYIIGPDSAGTYLPFPEGIEVKGE